MLSGVVWAEPVPERVRDYGLSWQDDALCSSQQTGEQWRLLTSVTSWETWKTDTRSTSKLKFTSSTGGCGLWAWFHVCVL